MHFISMISYISNTPQKLCYIVFLFMFHVNFFFHDHQTSLPVFYVQLFIVGCLTINTQAMNLLLKMLLWFFILSTIKIHFIIEHQTLKYQNDDQMDNMPIFMEQSRSNYTIYFDVINIPCFILKLLY